MLATIDFVILSRAKNRFPSVDILGARAVFFDKSSLDHSGMIER